MAINKITEKTVAEELKSSAHVLITQPETVEGQETESLRRLPIETLSESILTEANNGELGKRIQDVSDNQITAETEPADIVHIEDAARATAKGVDIAITPKQAGSGDPSSSNIRAISGWTSVKLGRASKNMLPKMVAGTYTERGVTVTVDADGVATFSGTAASTGNGPIVPLAEEFVIPKAGLIYCLNNSAATAGITPTIERASGGGAALTWSTTPANRQITMGADKVGVSCARIRFYVTNGTVASGTYAPAIVAEADSYEPNDGENSLDTIALPSEAGTVYGGTLHIGEDGSGVLTVTHGIIASYDGETLPGEWISDRDVYAEGTTPTTGAQVVYELAAPDTYNLTAAKLGLMKGANYIYADCGNVAVEYVIGTKGYIDSATEDVSGLKTAVDGMTTATASDAGKALKAKTVADGKVTEWEFGETATIDDTLTQAGQAADAKKTGDEIGDLKSQIEQQSSDFNVKISTLKNPIVACLQHVVWTDDDGQSYIDNLINAFKTFELSYITATYTNASAVSVTVSLDSLKQYTTVTAHNANGSTETVADANYTLEGSLYDGNNTITVKYLGRTTTITVAAEEPELPQGYTAYDWLKRTIAIGTYNDGSSSIITDIAMSSDYTMDADLFVASESNTVVNFPIMGNRNNTNPVNQFGIWTNAKLQKLGYQLHGITNLSGGSNITGDMALSKGEKHSVKINPVGKSAVFPGYMTIAIDGTEYATTCNTTGQTWRPWLTFFSIGASATTISQGGSIPEAGVKIGRVAIRNADNTCIHYLIPANDGTHYGLYDAVGEKMYYSADHYENFVCENDQ